MLILSGALRRVGFALGVCVLTILTATAAYPLAVSSAEEATCTLSAARTLSWGLPTRSAEFGDTSSLAQWHLYDSPNMKFGTRTPRALSLNNGLATITGDASGNTEGMAWLPGDLYGRWEVCARSPAGSPGYHPVLLLWPDSENWPVDGEIDFMEILDPSRQNVTATLHHTTSEPEQTFGPEDFATTSIDATQWHSWSVDWTANSVRGYVDGTQWFELTTNIPSTPMHLCIQLDNFGGDLGNGGKLIIDWAREYAAG